MPEMGQSKHYLSTIYKIIKFFSQNFKFVLNDEFFERINRISQAIENSRSPETQISW